MGYSQECLAEMIGEKQQTISDWEKCEHLDNTILERVAKALEIGVIWLKDIVMDSSNNQYYVQNSGTSFIETEHVAYAIHNPLEAMDEIYQNSITTIKKNCEDTIKSLQASLDAEREDKRRILDILLGNL
ncbi:XRE family transcriptional regulator [Bacteroides sp. 519]|nr:XRE family transcriptional regulator [Bacteroides sp. 519]